MQISLVGQTAADHFMFSPILDFLLAAIAVVLAFVIIWDGKPRFPSQSTKLKWVLSVLAIIIAPVSIITQFFPLSPLDILMDGCLLVIVWNQPALDGMPGTRQQILRQRLQ
jgi:hypothetical protein